MEGMESNDERREYGWRSWMKTCIIIGTRPEVIKMSPVVRACEGKGADYFVIHTGQHYSYNMDRVFFEQLGLPDAKYNLDVRSGRHGEQTGRMLTGIEKILIEEKPDVVLVEGDTNTVLAGALAASKLGVMVGHLEAGLRSYDKRMPEEINRVVADHISDYLFAPTVQSREILLGEGISDGKIFVTGNTVVDAVYQNLKIVNDRDGDRGTGHDLESNGYFLATAHRQENVDDAARFAGILRGLELVSKEFSLPVIYPIHPRARKMMDEFSLDAEGVTFIEPLDYLSFLKLESAARLVLTDSGGVQEESCILKVPCVTLRDNTERPETAEVGANVLVGVNHEKILEGVRMMIDRTREWENPFGNGNAGKRIVKIITNSGRS
ncbi:MAG: UDP-N-acetylglucosamine 2-epimerase [Candidatus Argoarchaeum ethanivorans]|uniref:UDP-N-acetylglucosamine 2-epimerase n=1 Tax=Candidatus Argoarchaeum ethanivorans TaxID=2608793 RepID=A0A812A0Z7_9EURY|nr:MAG: UDP-N-acetylglucosamine 2-epimerase [Candidatus Argoarchaeum ethanivorans]CAD7766629.1 MAG: UDP-N-acetylglucosamine 2-epimerase [Candidatus Argoarchaeum ethanivorans]